MPVRDDRRAVVDGAALAGTMNREGLPGVIFTAACFTPYASKHKGEPCEGVLLHVSDAHAFRSVRTGVTLLYRIREMWPRQFRWKPRDGKPRRFISLLAGCGAPSETVTPTDSWPDSALVETNVSGLAESPTGAVFQPAPSPNPRRQPPRRNPYSAPAVVTAGTGRR